MSSIATDPPVVFGPAPVSPSVVLDWLRKIEFADPQLHINATDLRYILLQGEDAESVVESILTLLVGGDF